MPKPRYIQVAIPTPLRRVFDYLPVASGPEIAPEPGQRVQVPFGRRSVVGIIVSGSDHTDVPRAKLKYIEKYIDTRPVLNQKQLALLQWASDYYQHPVGEVIFNSLPTLLRKGRVDEIDRPPVWKVTQHGWTDNVDSLSRSPRQLAILEHLKRYPEGLPDEQLKQETRYSASALKALTEKKLITATLTPPRVDIQTNNEILLNSEQQQATQTIIQSLNRFQGFLLDGVTGSGKTEVYIRLIKATLQAGKQVIVLVPEIALTPQLIQRMQSGIEQAVAVYHSGLSDRERLNHWIEARDGKVNVILGTRSAIWIPLSSAGLFIVDEEHDMSYKQQEGFRYNARDIALVRAKRSACPVVLGTATPSLESLHNLKRKQYCEIRLTERTANATLPDIEIYDMKTVAGSQAISDRLKNLISKTLDRQEQVLVFQNRRGYSPALVCRECEWLAECERCNKLMTMHKRRQRLWCHHCDKQIPIPEKCPGCDSGELIQVGHGTERIEETLADHFPGKNIIRIDRDTTRQKGSMEKHYANILSGQADILVGTQMLAKGHHFPNVTLVAVVDIDSSLYSTDFRATERLGQLVTQVSGRAGRSDKKGHVIIQTNFPEHPLLQCLFEQGYRSFAERLLQEREQAGLPPGIFMSVLRAEANQPEQVESFLRTVRNLDNAEKSNIQLIGPITAPLARKAGRYRMQLIIQSASRQSMHQFLRPWLAEVEQLKQTRSVRWSIDVDPQDMM